MLRYFLVVSAILLYSVCGLPVGPDLSDPELNACYAEGDMILNDIETRSGYIDVNRRWPENTVYYKIIGAFGKLSLSLKCCKILYFFCIKINLLFRYNDGK